MDLFALGAVATFLAILSLAYVFESQQGNRLRYPVLEHLVAIARCGLPLGPGLLALAKERGARGKGVGPTRGALAWFLNPTGKEVTEDENTITDLAGRLETEGSLAGALTSTPDVFPTPWIELIRTGEQHGALPETLERIKAEERYDDSLREYAQGRLGYPIVLSILVGAVTLFLTSVIHPKNIEIMRSWGLEGVQEDRVAIAAGLAATLFLTQIVVFLGVWTLSQRGRLAGLLTRAGNALGSLLPWVGGAVRGRLHARWLGRVGGLLEAGATWHESLTSIGAAQPGRLGANLRAAGDLAREGQPLPTVLERALGRDAPAVLPVLLLHTNRTPDLGLACRTVGQRLEERARSRLLTAWDVFGIVPVLFLAAVVAAQAYAVWGFLLGIHQLLTEAIP